MAAACACTHAALPARLAAAQAHACAPQPSRSPALALSPRNPQTLRLSRPAALPPCARPRAPLSPCRALFGLGLPELLVIGGVAVVLFGPKQLPEIGKSLGKTVKGFQEAAKEFSTELKEAAKGEGDAAKDGELPAAKAAAPGEKLAQPAESKGDAK